MASEYYLWKYRNVQHDPEREPLSGKQKVMNWLYYHWWWLAAGAVLLWITLSMIMNALGIGRVKPDYIYAYVGSNPPSDESTAALEAALSSIGMDQNGDGKTVVEFRRYSFQDYGDAETTLAYRYADDTKLVSDIANGESLIFITDDPEALQSAYQIYGYFDGSAPSKEDESIEGKVCRWKDLDPLASLSVDQAVTENWYIGRRYFIDQDPSKSEITNYLWQLLTQSTAD